jgi:hypothetical protein
VLKTSLSKSAKFLSRYSRSRIRPLSSGSALVKGWSISVVPQNSDCRRPLNDKSSEPREDNENTLTTYPYRISNQLLPCRGTYELKNGCETNPDTRLRNDHIGRKVAVGKGRVYTKHKCSGKNCYLLAAPVHARPLYSSAESAVG